MLNRVSYYTETVYAWGQPVKFKAGGCRAPEGKYIGCLWNNNII